MSLKKAYLYLVSTISLVIMVVGGIMIINLALRTWVLTKADQNFYSQPCIASKPTTPDGTPATCTAEEQARQVQQDKDNRAAQRQSTAAQAIAMILVASPVWYFHWRLARKEV